MPDKWCTKESMIRHAEHFGCDEVYETALQCHWSGQRLGRLAAQLTRIDKARVARDRERSRWSPEPAWRLTNEQRNDLLDRLDDEGVPPRQAAIYTGVTASTVNRHRQSRIQSGEVDAKRDNPTRSAWESILQRRPLDGIDAMDYLRSL